MRTQTIPPKSTPQVGQVEAVLDHKYRLRALLGRGGMGEVWRAEHLGLHAPVAVKLLSVEYRRNAEFLARFALEAQSAANLRSPHVVQILDHGVDATSLTPYIVMELLEGESLETRLTQRKRLTPRETYVIATHVGRALQRAHDRGIIHRDLKPANIFLVKNDDEEIAKVLDFGIARWEGEGGPRVVTSSGFAMGTPFYMSPEQIIDPRRVDARADLWALAATLFECVCGEVPFNGSSIMEIGVRICSGVAPRGVGLGAAEQRFNMWAERAFAYDPRQRYSSARELAESFWQCFHQGPSVSDGPLAGSVGEAAVATPEPDGNGVAVAAASALEAPAPPPEGALGIGPRPEGVEPLDVGGQQRTGAPTSQSVLPREPRRASHRRGWLLGGGGVMAATAAALLASWIGREESASPVPSVAANRAIASAERKTLGEPPASSINRPVPAVVVGPHAYASASAPPPSGALSQAPSFSRAPQPGAPSEGQAASGQQVAGGPPQAAPGASGSSGMGEPAATPRPNPAQIHHPPSGAVRPVPRPGSSASPTRPPQGRIYQERK